MCIHFGPSDYEDFDEALTKLQQTGTIREYQTQFERLVARVCHWPQRALVGSYVSELKGEIRSEVKLFQPTTLLHATSLARLLEEKLSKLRRPSSTATPPSLHCHNPHHTNLHFYLLQHPSKPPYPLTPAPDLQPIQHSRNCHGLRCKLEGKKAYATILTRGSDQGSDARRNKYSF